MNQSTQIDFSTSYEITKQFTVFAEALNLNNATYKRHARPLR